MEHRATRPKLSLSGVGVAADGGDAHAQGHDEGHGHGAGGDAAGVKGDGEKVPGDKGGQGEDNQIEAPPAAGCRGTRNRMRSRAMTKEDAHPHGHRPDEHRVGHAGAPGWPAPGGRARTR